MINGVEYFTMYLLAIYIASFLNQIYFLPNFFFTRLSFVTEFQEHFIYFKANSLLGICVVYIFSLWLAFSIFLLVSFDRSFFNFLILIKCNFSWKVNIICDLDKQYLPTHKITDKL